MTLKKYVYVAYSRDKYKLPLYVADSVQELSAMTGIKKQTISSLISRANRLKKECCYMKVDISDTD